MKFLNYFVDPNEAVLTTAYVLNKQDKITKVYHHLEDGMWEFNGETKVEESDYRIVSLEEMIAIDNTLLSLSDMDPGYFAFRAMADDTFAIEKMTDET